jgi:RNA polymerase sigma-70 factor (ECF subfamily)
MEQRSDEELIAGSLKGHRGDFKLLLERYEGELFNFLYHTTGDRQAAEDLFQEAFMQVFANIEKFRPGATFRPWLYTIAANLARDEMRRRRRRKSVSLDAEVRPGEETRLGELVDSGSADPSAQASSQESSAMAAEMMNALPASLREVVVLYFYNDMKYTEISEALGLPMGTVKSRLYRAIREMAEAMKRKRGF